MIDVTNDNTNETLNDTLFSTGDARILVIGVGGGGNNAVDGMIADGVTGVDFVVVNTDNKVLAKSLAKNKVQIGAKLTKGLGVGGKPEIGKKSAEESIEELSAIIDGYEMVFVTAGMGGGTGTGAAPVIAALAKEKGILTVGVVTKPFEFEGPVRAKNASIGIEELKKAVDSLIVVPNERLMEIAGNDKNMTMIQCFKMADDILKQGVTGITTLISNPGYINVDFADVKTVMENKGIAHFGIGRARNKSKDTSMLSEASEKTRATIAAELAISSPLLETSIRGAKSILINFIGNPNNLGMYEAKEAHQVLENLIDPGAAIFFGTSFDESLEDEVIITIIGTDLSEESEQIAVGQPAMQQPQAMPMQNAMVQPQMQQQPQAMPMQNAMVQPQMQQPQVMPNSNVQPQSAIYGTVHQVAPSNEPKEAMRPIRESGVNFIDIPDFLKRK